MPIQNPPQSDKQDVAAWQFEATQKINEVEQRLSTLLYLIKTTADHATLKEKVKKI